jgi:hypothetical protein
VVTYSTVAVVLTAVTVNCHEAGKFPSTEVST